MIENKFCLWYFFEMCFFVYLAIDFVYDIKMNDLFLSVMVRFAVVFE